MHETKCIVDVIRSILSKYPPIDIENRALLTIRNINFLRNDITSNYIDGPLANQSEMDAICLRYASLGAACAQVMAYCAGALDDFSEGKSLTETYRHIVVEQFNDYLDTFIEKRKEVKDADNQPNGTV